MRIADLRAEFYTSSEYYIRKRMYVADKAERDPPQEQEGILLPVRLVTYCEVHTENKAAIAEVMRTYFIKTTCDLFERNEKMTAQIKADQDVWYTYLTTNGTPAGRVSTWLQIDYETRQLQLQYIFQFNESLAIDWMLPYSKMDFIVPLVMGEKETECLLQAVKRLN